MTLDRNRPVQTRDGKPVRIITWTEGTEIYPVVGEIEGVTGVHCWTPEGYLYSSGVSGNDLVNVPPKQTVTWHRCCAEGGGYICGNFDSSDAARDTFFPNTLAGLLKITWEDNKPISVELEEV